VSGGSVQFGVSTADRVLLGRAQEVDVVAVMSPFQESPRCIIVHKKSGITKFEELKNLTLAISPGGTFSQYLQKKLPLEGVKIVPYPGNVSQFLLDENYAQQAYVFSEPFVAEKEGGDPHSLMASDLGYNPYNSILITTSKTISENPALVQKMVAASIRGWQSYLENPDETNKHINGLNPEMGLDILAYGVKALKPLCITEAVPKEQLGLMTAERWIELASQLVEAEAIDSDTVDPATAFTVQFLNSSE
jgi:NitT/TauT family transport system substrate-binding protein